jgi:hypothetical protein
MSSIETETARSPNDNAPRYADQHDADVNDPALIERNIDATRADMRETLAALERKLSPDRLVELTLGRIQERGGEFATNLTNTATQNPVPVVLTAIGIGWMMLMSRRNGHSGSASRPTASMRERAAGVRASVMSASDRASEQVHGTVDASRAAFDSAAESVRDTAGRAARATRSKVESVREGAEHAQERMQRMLDEQPLMLGALGLAAGALIGALLPSTESEDRLVGDVRESVVQKVARTSRTMHEAAKASASTYSAPATADDSERERPRTH